jgi:hypothetical protein
MTRFASVLLLSLALAGCGLFGGNVFDLEVGDCFNDGDLGEGATEVDNLPIVDCEELHDNEVFATFDMTEASYPGDETTQQIAFEGCIDRFDAWIGLPYEDSALDVTYLYPTQQTWDDGDREIVCAVYRLDGIQVTGTLEGSAQ